MAKLIATANMKGGVGKTATVVGLAETLAARAIEKRRRTGVASKPVLVIDLDAQASASFALAGDYKLTQLIRSGRTIDGFLDRYLIKSRNEALETSVSHNISDVSHMGEPLEISLLASSPDLRKLERGIIHALTRNGYSLGRVEREVFELMRAQINSMVDQFDYVIFDCPPGISILTEVAIRMAELTIVPTIPDFLSVLGLDAFQQNVWSQLSSGNAQLPEPPNRPYALITKRKNQISHDIKVAQIRSRVISGAAGHYVFATEIQESPRVPNAIERIDSQPTYVDKWDSALRTRLAELVDEINVVLGVG
jgi:cellulose biosynthesis protein BcsQ